MAKNQGIDPKASTAARIKRTEAYAEKVRLLFAQTVNEILALNKTMPKLDDGVMFSFDGESMKKQKEVEALLRRLHSSVTMAIREGVSLEWAEANAEADKLIKSVFGQAVLDSSKFTAWTQRNTAARDAFLARSEKGLNLSDRVWKSVRQLRDELEVAVTVSMGEGKSASAMSREVRQYLNDPDLMFRRFRYKKGEDADGNPIYGRKWKKRVKDEATGKYKWIDYDRDSYKTGAGVYKSSAKNAMRLTRTETNIAYRRADHERWQQMDFVLGQRVQLSKSHPKPDICDKLQGDYPKEFVFDGWHPQCFCFVTPILADDDELKRYNKALLNGEDYRPKGKVTEYPDNFKDWVREHAEDIADARDRGTEPYFIRNNAGVIDEILNPQPKELSIAEKAALRHAARTPEQEDAIRRAWAERNRLREEAAKQYIEDSNEAINYVKMQLMQYASIDRRNNNTAYEMGFNDQAMQLVEKIANGDFGFASKVAQTAVNSPNWNTYGYRLSEKQAFIISQSAVKNRLVLERDIKGMTTIFDYTGYKELMAKEAAKSAEKARKYEMYSSTFVKSSTKVAVGSIVIDAKGKKGVISSIITQSTGYVVVKYDDGTVSKQMAFNLLGLDGNPLKKKPKR